MGMGMSGCWHWCFYEPFDIFQITLSFMFFLSPYDLSFYYCKSTFNHSANKKGRIWWKGWGDECEGEDGPVSGWPAGDLQLEVSCVTFLICCTVCVCLWFRVCRIPVLVCWWWWNNTFYQPLKVHSAWGQLVLVWEFAYMDVSDVFACVRLCVLKI